MPPEILALVDKPVLLIAILFVGAVIGIYVEKFVRWQNRREWQRRNERRGKALPLQPKHDAIAKVPDAADQLRTVMKADFKAQPLLNKSEVRLFKAIDKWVIELRPGWQVMAQVSLGEILRCEDKAAYACINSKRVDLLIVDDESRPLHAIEYQGGAHFKGAHATAARDAVKKEALRRAGIGYVEVVAGDTPAELRRGNRHPEALFANLTRSASLLSRSCSGASRRVSLPTSRPVIFTGEDGPRDNPREKIVVSYKAVWVLGGCMLDSLERYVLLYDLKLRTARRDTEFPPLEELAAAIKQRVDDGDSHIELPSYEGGGRPLAQDKESQNRYASREEISSAAALRR